MQIKNYFNKINKLIFILLIFPGFLYASNELENDCQFIISQPNINYGVLSRDNMKHVSSGEVELISRNVTARIICKNDINPIIKIQDFFGENTKKFKYGKDGTLQISLTDYKLDGLSTKPTIFRNNVTQSSQLLNPDDEIKPQTNTLAKNIELTLSITPKISESELTNPSAVSQLGQFSLNIKSLPASTIFVSSELQAIACIPSVSNNGIVDYYTINSNSLSSNNVTVLPARILNFTISCDAATNIAIRARSNRLSTTTDAGNENSIGSAQANSILISAGLGKNLPLGLPNITQAFVAGLGISNGQKIGGYLLNLPFTQIQLDGKTAVAKYWTPTLPNNSNSWTKETDLRANGGSLFTGTASYFSFSSDLNSTVPLPFKQLEGALIIQAYITNKNNLDLTSPVYLDGSSTIELFYY